MVQSTKTGWHVGKVIFQALSVPAKGVKPAQLDLVSSLVIHIGVAALDELYGQLVQLLKVIR